MEFTITIKDNETGEIIFDEQADAIIAGVGTEEHAISLSRTSCNGLVLIETMRAAKSAIGTLEEAHPEIVAMSRIKDLFIERTEKNE